METVMYWAIRLAIVVGAWYLLKWSVLFLLRGIPRMYQASRLSWSFYCWSAKGRKAFGQSPRKWWRNFLIIGFWFDFLSWEKGDQSITTEYGVFRWWDDHFIRARAFTGHVDPKNLPPELANDPDYFDDESDYDFEDLPKPGEFDPDEDEEPEDDDDPEDIDEPDTPSSPRFPSEASPAKNKSE